MESRTWGSTCRKLAKRPHLSLAKALQASRYCTCMQLADWALLNMPPAPATRPTLVTKHQGCKGAPWAQSDTGPAGIMDCTSYAGLSMCQQLPCCPHLSQATGLQWPATAGSSGITGLHKLCRALFHAQAFLRLSIAPYHRHGRLALYRQHCLGSALCTCCARKAV